MSEQVVPYQDKKLNKKKQVELMFDSIAPRYDLLNHLLSLNIDKLWRKKAVKILKKEHPKLILDVATGTADFAIEALKLQPEKVTGVDISAEMLNKGRQKIEQKKLEDKIELQKADSENLPFEDNFFDAVTVGFGVRNFENIEKGLREMQRVLKKGGTVCILEFSRPAAFPFRQLFGFYFNNILPLVGKLVSKDKSAYTYLPESVAAFPEGQKFLDIMGRAGFSECRQKTLTFGIASIYLGKK